MKSFSLHVMMFIAPVVGVAQSMTMSGHIEQGHVQDIHHVSVNLNDVSVHLFRAAAPNVGISYSPLQIKGIRAGVIATRHGLPTPKDMAVNFIVDAGFEINAVRISWLHISNGFGLWHRPNHGFDAITLTINMGKL